MKITWKIEDEEMTVGYKENMMEIDDQDLAEFASDVGREEFIEDCVQDEFERTVTFSWKRA